jgi:hypothetical protein
MTEGRRALQFASLTDVMADVEGLRSGYRAVGQWTLGQVCRHLSVALLGTLRNRPQEGAPASPTPEQLAAREMVFQGGRFPEGAPIPHDRLVPPPGLDDQAEVEGLRGALDRYTSTPGEFGPHPRLGSITRDEWDRFHAVHCAHHLSFLVPGTAS